VNVHLNLYFIPRRNKKLISDKNKRMIAISVILHVKEAFWVVVNIIIKT